MKKFVFLVLLIPLVLISFALASEERAARVQFTYKVEIPPPKTKFTKMKIWLPMPAESDFQKVTAMKISTSLKYEVNREPKSGNKMLFFEVNSANQFPVTIEATYDVSRFPASTVDLDRLSERQYWNPQSFLNRDKRVPLTGEIAKIATEQTAGLTTDDEKIRSIFKYVTNSMTYNKDGTGWGEGDAVWACNAKRGNCTDFHSLLIGMARSQKIPAKFEIGFSIPAGPQGVIPGYHCWAWVFSGSQKSWIPLDSSEAKNNGKLFEYLGHLPDDRIQFTSGRDLILSPRQDGAPLNYFIYPYVELDGKLSTEFKKEFSFKRL